MQHLDDDAELYALGLTAPERNAEIEAHLAECAACRTRVAEAESVAASLAAALPPMTPGRAAAAPPKRSWIAPLALAASLAFAATATFEAVAAHGAAAQLATATSQISATNFALFRVASSHFEHTTLTARRGVVAKAIYARDGSWCYVIVAGAPGAHVIVHRGALALAVGTLAKSMPLTFFVDGLGPVDRIDVVAGNAVVAHGSPVY
jgi:hypothetical protein